MLPRPGPSSLVRRTGQSIGFAGRYLHQLGVHARVPRTDHPTPVPASMDAVFDQLRATLPAEDAEQLIEQMDGTLRGGVDQAWPAAAFLEAFWSPKSGILGALARDDDLVVHTIAGRRQAVASALPESFGGRRVKVVETTVSPAYPALAVKLAEKEQLAKPVVLLTGASAGLGLELARQLAETGMYRLALTARASSLRRFDEVGWVKNEDIILLPLDVADPEQRAGLADTIVQKWGGADILINNAGTGYMASVEHDTQADRDWIFATNFHGPMDMASKMIPLMRMKGHGRILNVSSIASGIGAQLASSYIGSRGALDAATNSLRQELEPFGVHVSLVSPGWIHNDAHTKLISGLPERVREAMANPEDPYHSTYNTLATISEWGSTKTNATEEEVAGVLLDVVTSKRPKGKYWLTGDARWFDRLRRFLPQRAYETFIRKNTELPWSEARDALGLSKPQRPSVDG